MGITIESSVFFSESMLFFGSNFEELINKQFTYTIQIQHTNTNLLINFFGSTNVINVCIKKIFNLGFTLIIISNKKKIVGVPVKNNIMIPKVLRRMSTDDSDSNDTSSSNKENVNSTKAAIILQSRKFF